MQHKLIQITYLETESHDELAPEDLKLLSMASGALQSAYVPYSHYRVGAAVLLENGEIVTGSNQENMAFPSGLCAERVAIFSAVSHFPGVPVRAIAITAKSEDFPVSEPVTPCGSCRQVMIEYESNQGSPVRLILGCETGRAIQVEKAADLLPLSFKEDMLRK
jgi:cytidine deaminase